MPDYTTTPQVIPTLSDNAAPTLLKTIENVQQGVPPVAGTNGMEWLGMGILGLMALIFILVIATTVLWIWSIVHIAKNENFTDENQRIIWLLIVIFTGIFGSIVYFFAKPKN